MNHKKQLHPNLYHIFAGESGNSKFYGGTLDLFGIILDISWNEKESSWSISNISSLTDEDMQNGLSALFDALKSEFIYRVFSDEENISVEEFVKKYPNGKIFWADNGNKYIFAQKHLDQDMYICIELKESKIEHKNHRFELTQNVRIFSGEDMISTYPGEYYGIANGETD